jgi:hypothetical protein
MMSQFVKIGSLVNVNTAEAVFGDMIIRGNRVFIPFHNVNVLKSDVGDMSELGGKYIRRCYLVFSGVSGIVWDYELSRFQRVDSRECYGGTYYLDNVHREFWVQYEKGDVIVEENYLVSVDPWRFILEDELHFFRMHNVDSELLGF